MVDKAMKTLTVGEVRYIITDATARENLSTLDTNLKAATAATANLHLGFYLDENGDLCQVDDD